MAFTAPAHWWLYRRDHHSTRCPNYALGGTGKAGSCQHCLTYKGKRVK